MIELAVRAGLLFVLILGLMGGVIYITARWHHLRYAFHKARFNYKRRAILRRWAREMRK